MIPVTGNLQKKFNLPIIEVVAGGENVQEEAFSSRYHTGKIVTPDSWTDWKWPKQRKRSLTGWKRKSLEPERQIIS